MMIRRIGLKLTQKIVPNARYLFRKIKVARVWYALAVDINFAGFV